MYVDIGVRGERMGCVPTRPPDELCCLRCGWWRKVNISRQAEPDFINVCTECKRTDPWYVEQIRKGKR